MLTAVKSKINNVTICTVHETVPNIEERALIALSLFNEVILKEAFRLNIPVIDLRLTCNEVSDYSVVSPVEPSKNGAKNY